MRSLIAIAAFGFTAISAPAFAQDTITLDPGLYSGTTLLKAKNGKYEHNSPLGPMCLTVENNQVGWDDYVPLSKTIEACKFNVLSKSEGRLTTQIQCNIYEPAGYQQLGVGIVGYDNDEVVMEFDGYLSKRGAQAGIPITVLVEIARTGDCK